MQPDWRPVDAVWPERRAAIQTGRCSIGLHDISPEDRRNWRQIDHDEYRISGCCPTCWDSIMGKDQD